VLRRALIPWSELSSAEEEDKELRTWMDDWVFAVDVSCHISELC